eukprot:3496758-Pyramimonas_sp.AAC.1
MLGVPLRRLFHPSISVCRPGPSIAITDSIAWAFIPHSMCTLILPRTRAPRQPQTPSANANCEPPHTCEFKFPRT